MPFTKTALHGVPLTRENFQSPPPEMGILPFWFWNGEMDEREMEWQLRQYKEKGIPGLFIHGRFGLKVPYISDAWFEKVKYAVAKGKEIGLDIWVYDEMNWPSGTAERQVLQKYPHLTQKYLELVALNVDGPLFTFLEATDNRYVNTGNSNPVAAFGCTEEEYRNGIKHLIDLTPNLSFEKVIPWEAPPGKWRLLYFLEKEVPYYIDTMNPESTNRFIELTHERYRQAVGSEFGNVVPGFYTDEPAMHYYHVGIDNFVIPWTSRMFKVFRDRRGYDLRPLLPALYVNMGPRTAQIRYDFWRTLTEQYTQTYYKRLHDWCEEHGVLFTGHLLFEEWIRMHARCEGNLFSYLKQMHIVGVDHLYPKIGTEQEPDQHVALKIASSAAHHFGSTRVLCESMGGTYWDCTLQRMRWIANWEYVLGVNLFNNHGYHYSIEGERKRDWPPSQFYHHTWWKYYDQFTRYMARLSHILSGGRHVAKVLVLYPLNSIWTNYVPQERNAIGNVIEADYNFLTDSLLRLHYDFDFVDEEVLAEARIENGEIRIRDEEYSVFIVPPVTHIRRSTLHALRTFARQGGKVIADTLLPLSFLDEEKDGAVREVSKLFGVNPDTVVKDFLNDKAGTIRTVSRKSNIYFFKGKGLAAAGGRNALRDVLRRCVVPDVTVSDGNVFYLHRQKDGVDVYFFANTATAPSRGVEISFERTGRPELWDLGTGRTAPLHVYQIKNGRLCITIDFAPAQGHIVVISKKTSAPHIRATNLVVEEFDGINVCGYPEDDEKTISAAIDTGSKSITLKAPAGKHLRPLSLGKEFTFQLESSNALLLGSWRMTIDEGGGLEKGFHRPEFDDASWPVVSNGAWEMQLGEEREMSTYPVTLWYRRWFNAEFIPDDLRIVIDGFSGLSHKLFVNGQEISEPGKRSAIDAEMREVAIRQQAVEGRNCIAVMLVVNRRTDGILDLLKILGDFALRKENEGYAIIRRTAAIKAGDWTKLGYPFYSGTAMYRTEFDVREEYLTGAMMLEVECGEDVLEVSVNGSEGRVVPWYPYRTDISELLKAGKNVLELRVTNTLINVLEGVQKISGILATPKLVHHRRYILSPGK
jgi:hypothetical protein